MDCEKFESIMIDELYDELDELTSAAAKRHLASCARCSALLDGLRAARRTAVLPTIEPPLDLEDRILTAARDAQREAPFRDRLSRAVSRAGGWAMRPQTAMAAVFLLMIGSSVLLLKGKSKAPSSANVTVSEEGAPAPSVVAGTVARPSDLASADHAHGVPGAAPRPASPPAFAGGYGGASASGPGSTSEAPSFARPPAADRASSGVGEGSGATAAPAKRAYAKAERSREGEATGGLGATDPARQELARAERGSRDDAPAESKGAGRDFAGAPPQAAAAAAPVEGEPASPGAAAGSAPASAPSTPGADDFESASAAYAARRYDDAARLFDAAASHGTPNAALWAARSVSAGHGCQAAVDRFETVATHGAGTQTGYDATLEAGRCYRQLGDSARARADFNRLLAVPTHAQRARAELDAMAARRSAPAATKPAP